MDKNLQDYSKDELISIVSQLGEEKMIAETMVSEITNDYLGAKREVIKVTQYASNLEKSLDSLGKQVAGQMSEQENQAREATENPMVNLDPEGENF